MSRRRIERLTWSNGLRRRSPRISALDQQQVSVKKDTPLPLKGYQTRERSSLGVKRKCQFEGVESPDLNALPTSDDDIETTRAKGKKIFDNGQLLMPEKRILELVLDVLQRRDTYEIFAEPVDPQEVEEYYEIVKEPMDFGTMRAKLHEGMYKTLEEFEHDAFLIPKNGMLFNSMGSVYFRQARAIDDLAKKVFHVLKTNPKKIETEFPETRRRSSRRLQGEGKGLQCYTRSRLSRNTTSSGTTSFVSSRGEQSFDNGPLEICKSMEEDPRLSFKVSSGGTRGSQFSPGVKDKRSSNAVEVDRHSSYALGMNDSEVSLMPGGPRLLTNVIQHDLTYSDSLMKFAKDLGPTAQMVAKRKLQQGYTLLQQNHGTLCALIDLNDIDDGSKYNYTSQDFGTENNIPKLCDGDRLFKSHVSRTREGFLRSSINVVEDLNSSGIRLNNPGKETSGFSRNNSDLKFIYPRPDSEKVENSGGGINFGDGFQRGFSNLRPMNEITSVSPFAYNLSFFKSKLNQMEQYSGQQVLGVGSNSGGISSNETSFQWKQQLSDRDTHSSMLANEFRQYFVPQNLGSSLALKL